MFFHINTDSEKPIYIQIFDAIKEMIETNMLPAHSKLPSTREMGRLLGVSRSTVITAFECLESSGFIYTLNGKGTFVSPKKIKLNNEWNIDWKEKFNQYAYDTEDLDLMKNGMPYKKGMISFKSIAPDENLFDIDEIKRSFMDLMGVEGNKILNYGYAKGYRPLINFIMEYMKKIGAALENKSVIITNGFTEGFDLVLDSLTSAGDKVLCENPTHNTAIKQMRLHGLDIHGVNMDENGMDVSALESELLKCQFKLAYLIPSYHNPTGISISYDRRKELYDVFKQHNVPIVEDGFSEELQHHSSHIAPMVAVSGKENSVIYIGSFSKILFPGMRIGWIFGDEVLIDMLQSVKRAKNIHTSFLDQGILYHYMQSGSYEKYIKKIRNIYGDKCQYTIKLIKKYLPWEYISGEGGLYVFIKLKNIDSHKLLENCYKRGVLFMPGDVFYVENPAKNALRLSFSRNSYEELEKGIKIIGEECMKF
ncbi:PLP-dependent aminotransferase family protein [Clostridium oryzae]|uniref:2-aminoadipate transaminase n=1 Tax=Clostridium oryzae TaxID=1450648 RepID=A0A1V4IRH1_9CLOT|nr:PLP-dependent aminotransferase family protein [Clostridium oryzae]OPJ62410.1 2-aminoadipate transaminase [Clostridium oryzae]